MDLTQKNAVNALFGFYGALLTEKQQRYLQYYFEDDLTLPEIAEEEGISRQAVSDNLKRSIDALAYYEAVLHLQAEFLARRELAIDLQNYAQMTYPSDTDLTKKIQALLQRDLLENEED